MGSLGLLASWRHDLDYNYAFNFVPFVFLNKALSIMMISCAFVAVGEEIKFFRGSRNVKTSDKYSTAKKKIYA